MCAGVGQDFPRLRQGGEKGWVGLTQHADSMYNVVLHCLGRLLGYSTLEHRVDNEFTVQSFPVFLPRFSC